MIVKEFFLIFALFSTPDGEEFPVGKAYFMIEKCITRSHCKKKAAAYEKAWPFISEYGKWLTLQQEIKEVI